jgi:hypothetical protein
VNALTNFQLTVKDVIPENVRKQVGRAAIETVINRIRNAEDVTDSPATPYSAHGPIYIPAAGKPVRQSRVWGVIPRTATVFPGASRLPGTALALRSTVTPGLATAYGLKTTLISNAIWDAQALVTWK